MWEVDIGVATKMVARVEELLSKEEAPAPNSEWAWERTLDSEIVELVEETHLVDEIDQADLYKGRIYSTLIKIDRVVDSISKPTQCVNCSKWSAYSQG